MTSVQGAGGVGSAGATDKGPVRVGERLIGHGGHAPQSNGYGAWHKGPGNKDGAGATANLTFSPSDPTVTPALLCAEIQGVTLNTTVASNGSPRSGNWTGNYLPKPFHMYTDDRPKFCAE